MLLPHRLQLYRVYFRQNNADTPVIIPVAEIPALVYPIQASTLLDRSIDYAKVWEVVIASHALTVIRDTPTPDDWFQPYYWRDRGYPNGFGIGDTPAGRFDLSPLTTIITGLLPFGRSGVLTVEQVTGAL